MKSNVTMKKIGLASVSLALALSFQSCDDDDTTQPAVNPVELKNRSVTPAFVKNLASGLEAYTLIGSDDVLPESPDFVFGGSADGSGWLKNADGTFTFILNHEDNYSVSRITMDKTLKPVKGEYIVTADHGKYRLCSATLATPEEHGFGPLFISGGETGPESQILAIDPRGGKNTFHFLEQLGRWSTENAVPLPKTAFPGKTVLVIGDDDSQDAGGQVVLYVSNTVGDLENGKLYVMARTDNTTTETDMQVGQKVNVEFREITNPRSLAPTDFNTKAKDLRAIAFGRTEDIDYRKGGGGNGREIYFTVTGQALSGANADGSRTKYGRIYRFIFDATDPLKGQLECVLNGDDKTGPASKFQDPDNICVTQNYVYIQEDSNVYGDETHDAYIYQYNIATKEVRVIMELDHHRGEEKYNQAVSGNPLGNSKFGSWEYGSLVDISDIVGIPNTFSLCIQPHTWTGEKYKNPDGDVLRANENQASQILIIKGLPR